MKENYLTQFLNGLKVPGESIPKTIDYLEKNKLGEKKLIFDLKIGEYQDKGIGDVLFLLLTIKIIILLKFQKIYFQYNYQK